MTSRMTIAGVGAVTAVGLTAAQTCAAIRARIVGFRESLLIPPPHAPVINATIPAQRHLKTTVSGWLSNMAARAIRECLDGQDVDVRNTALLLAVPEAYRRHEGVRRNPAALLTTIQRQLQASFHAASAVIEQGRAGAFTAVTLAQQLLERGKVRHCIVGGVDSLVNRADASRLAAAGRLHEPNNPQGTIPGEGAAVWLLAGDDVPGTTIAQVVGIGIDHEPDSALSERYGVGRGLRSALTAAVRDAGCDEAQIAFRVSDMNGERYHAWDSMLAATRFYRTRREHFPVWYPASSIGDIGAAAGALDVIVAANAIARGFAPGPLAMCEGSSDDGLRAACVVAAVSGKPWPPWVPDRR